MLALFMILQTIYFWKKKFTILITYICTQLYCNNNIVKII